VPASGVRASGTRRRGREGNCDIATPEGARIRHVPVGFFTPDRNFGPPTVVALARHRRTFPPCGKVLFRLWRLHSLQSCSPD
jgi:hypothetical protein